MSSVYLILFNCSVNFEPYYTFDIKWANLLFCMVFLYLAFTCSQVLSVPEGEDDETIIVISAWLAQHIDFMGFTCVTAVMSTCALNNLCSDTVSCWLPGLLSTCGSCSYVGFLSSSFFLK